MPDAKVTTIVLEVWEVGGCIQLSIGQQDEKGWGHGYRITGPSFAGNSTLLTSKVLNERDAKEIRSYLDKIEPPGKIRE